MTPAPKPPNDAERLQTLHGLNVLDTPPDPVLDGLVRSAALALGCPISLVSLVDTDRQWFKAAYGLAVTQTPRAPSFCGHAILGDTLFEVPDAAGDPRFADNPLVLGDPSIRFYAGVPIGLDGHQIGTLCVIDQQPRQLTDAQRGLLADLGRAATHWMTSWRQSQALDLHRQHLEARVAARTAELALAKQAAEAANEAKSNFLATMSHEIRTPMNGVVGIVDVLRQSSLTPYQADLADTIRDSAFALLGILDDILDFSKIEAGHLVLESEPVALLRLVEGVCDTLQPVASARRVALEVFVDPALPEWISGDAVRLRQILNNLLGNAIKFSAGLEREGRVRVRVDAVGADRLQLLVRDNGIGLSLAAQARVFDPFEQAEGSTSRRYGGTGLGLSICRRLVRAFGGEISVQSTLGQGADFMVSLPLRRCVSAPSPAPAEPASDLSGLVCHVVLDDEEQARDWCAYLSSAGATAQAWADPHALRRALAGVWEARPRVVLWQTEQFRDPLDAALEQLRRELELPATDWVWLTPGQRRSPRVIGPGQVVLDRGALHRAALLKAVALAAGRCAPDPLDLANGLPLDRQKPPSHIEATLQGRLVLVAEDNDINQKVIRRQLALLGLAVEVADNGLDALERARSGRFALLLTDLHMPGMDGYELASTLRREEAPGRRLPIVALTANALSGEADRCRLAGMDDYLSKPVQLDQLGATLARWLAPAVSPPWTSTPMPAEAAELPVFDETALARLIGDDPVQLDVFRRDFLVSTRATAQVLRTAAGRSDWAQAGALGHRLKSSARAMGAMAMGSSCAGLEQAGAAGDGVAVHAWLQRFEHDLAALLACLEGHPGALGGLELSASAEPTLMLVDDDPFQLQVLQRQLVALGVDTVQACSAGAVALQRLHGRDTSAMLLLLDLNMPDMDGVEFMRHLAELHFQGTLALVSGADHRVLETAAKLASAYQLHVVSHLHKPVPSAVLGDLVARWRGGFVPERVPHAARTRSPDEIERAMRARQFVLYYQPKVSLVDGALVGVEALVRWRHPVEGLLYPDSFIAVAEASGQIDALTRTVLSQALAQARRWRDAGMALRVAVNVSMDNLARLDFPEFVLREAAHHGVAPTDLMLEVTESRLMRDLRAPMDILTRLRLKQIGLSIDDFGTGHSSLAQLRDMPFDELKIDRGFVHGNREQATQRAIFTASLELAHQLDMTAVAEGVETRADWDFVRDAGCETAQGYFIGRPMPAEALPEWIRQWDKRTEVL